MTSKKGISATRLKTIYQRQREPSWDAAYSPAILATPQEAPSISRAFILTPEKLPGREAHTLSIAERDAALLGFYHPKVVGLQEQRMLSPDPTVHPLWTYSKIDRSALKPLKGVIDVAERLDLLDVLPRISVPDPEVLGQRMTVIYPWCGDLLWAIAADDGHVYCVNWTIKDKRQGFVTASPRNGRPLARGNPRAVLARHEIEAEFYADADIPTVQVAGEEIFPHVAANLRQLFLHHRRELALTDEQEEEILDKYQWALQLGITPAEVITPFAERGRYSVDQCRSVFYQAVWYRKLRLDLFRPILINRPMNPETRDVLDVYGDWFREGR